MKLSVKYFASLREALGPGGIVDWPSGADVEIATANAAGKNAQTGNGATTDAATVGALRAWLRTQSPTHAAALAPGRAVRVAVDQTMAHEGTALHDGAEVAFFPPVTGG